MARKFDALSLVVKRADLLKKLFVCFIVELKKLDEMILELHLENSPIVPNTHRAKPHINVRKSNYEKADPREQHVPLV